MQYLLTQEEYDELHDRGEKAEMLLHETLQDLCTKVCDNMVVDCEWGDPQHRIWGCIHTKKNWYCDQCPVQDVCPEDYKRFSK